MLLEHVAKSNPGRRNLPSSTSVVPPPSGKLSALQKDKITDAYPDKIEIKGGHTDVNRFLESKEKAPIYKDSDETKHKQDDKDDTDVEKEIKIEGV